EHGAAAVWRSTEISRGHASPEATAAIRRSSRLRGRREGTVRRAEEEAGEMRASGGSCLPAGQRIIRLRGLVVRGVRVPIPVSVSAVAPALHAVGHYAE